MIQRKVGITCLQETKWVEEKAKEPGAIQFKPWYTGKGRGKNVVGIIVDRD